MERLLGKIRNAARRVGTTRLEDVEGDVEKAYQRGREDGSTDFAKELQTILDDGCEVHDKNDADCEECHRDAFTRACTALFVVADSRGDQPSSVVLRTAARLAEKMEEIEQERGVEWSVGLAAEAVFDLAHVDKDPLPTHFHVLSREEDETFLPAVIAPVIDGSNSEARRLITGGGVKLNGNQVKDIKVPTKNLDRATLTIGKQGKAVFCHFMFDTRKES